ncbi:MAG: hypothetical protein H7336_06235 [Bacteriovorax sp.]|nr:hypothetical protein [Bacteriovorax sp.]
MIIKKILILIFNIFLINSAFAESTGAVLGNTAVGAAGGAATGYASTAAGQAAIEKVSPGFTESIGKYFDSPQGIVLMAGISTVYSYILYNGAANQEKESKANIEKIDKIIKSYSDSWTAYCPHGRDKLEEPSCYCYSADGKQNATRTNSQTCIDLWNKNKYSIDGTAANYNLAKFVDDPAGCVALDGQFDEACKCRKLINAKGQNACLKSTSISLPTGMATAIGESTALREVMKTAVNAANGNPNLGALSTGSLGAKAIASDHLTKSLLSSFGNKLGKNPPVFANIDNVDALTKKIFGEKAMEAVIANSKPVGTYASASMDPKSLKILQEVKAKNSLDFNGSGKGLGATKEKKKGFDLNIGGESGGNSGGQVLGNFPEEKNYKFKNSDIVTDNTASIFEIISNRYIQSGLKRLFDDDTK